jgi:ribosomal protein L14E/L6E/L27E
VEFNTKTVVLSLAGHDKGKLFAILGCENENYVFIADGRQRKAQKPKKKKVKHLKPMGVLDLINVASATNRELRNAIRSFASTKAINEQHKTAAEGLPRYEGGI